MDSNLVVDAEAPSTRVSSSSAAAPAEPATRSIAIRQAGVDWKAFLSWERFRTFLELATLVSIIVGVWQFYLDREDQRTSRIGNAWGLMISSSGSPGDFGRREALEVIRSSRHTLYGLRMDAAILPNLTLKDEVLTSASLVGAMLDTAQFDRVNLDSTDARRIRANAIALSRVSLHGARLDSAALRNFQINGSSGLAISAVGARLDGGRIADSQLYFSPADELWIQETRIDRSRIQLRGRGFTMRKIHVHDTEFPGVPGAILAGDVIDACLTGVRIFDLEAERLNWSLVTVENSDLTDLVIHSGTWSGVGLWNSTIKRTTIAADVLERIAGDSTELREVTVLPGGLRFVAHRPVVVDSGFIRAGRLTLFSAGQVQQMPIDERQQKQAATGRDVCRRNHAGERRDRARTE